MWRQAWSHGAIASVCVSIDNGRDLVGSDASEHIGYSWQVFQVKLLLPVRPC